LGLSPNQLSEYTDNDILEAVYFNHQTMKAKENDMKRQAWYNWMASTNRPMFGQERFKFTPFDQLFHEQISKPSSDPELTAKICKAHGLNLLEEPKDA
jgi:hypothetical protein